MYLQCYVCFFYEQKTADEMLISDWSSDVCSSDLCFRQIGKRFTTVPIAVAVAVDERFLAERRRQHRDAAVHRAWILYIQQDRTNACFGGRICVRIACRALSIDLAAFGRE